MITGLAIVIAIPIVLSLFIWGFMIVADHMEEGP